MRGGLRSFFKRIIKAFRGEETLLFEIFYDSSALKVHLDGNLIFDIEKKKKLEEQIKKL